MKLEYKRLSEVCIQGEFYHQCRLKNIPCYLGYKYKNCIFDAVIFNRQSREILLIVEVKSYLHSEKEATVHTKQSHKYIKYGIPVLYIVRLEEINWAISYIEKHVIAKKCKPCIIYKGIHIEEKAMFRI